MMVVLEGRACWKRLLMMMMAVMCIQTFLHGSDG
jgi:hypothetical protein